MGTPPLTGRTCCTFMNPAAEQLTGFCFEEVSGRVLHNFIHHTRPDGSPSPMPECPIDRALPESLEVRNHEDTFFRKDGSRFPVVCNARVIYEHGRAVGTVIEVRDVTEDKRAAATIDAQTSAKATCHARTFNMRKLRQLPPLDRPLWLICCRSMR